MTQVVLSEYQADWSSLFHRAEVELAARLAPSSARIEHIGSTAVVGMSAKPVIDIMLGLVALSDVESRIGGLKTLGYVYRPEYESELPERRYFVRPAGSTPRIHLHAVVAGSQIWERHLAFRDALRSDAALADEYSRLKRELAAQHATDKAAYTEAKAPFIQRVLATQLPSGSHCAL